MIKIYHNPRCRKSRAGLVFLNTKNIDFETVEYMKKSLSASEILSILKKSGSKIEDLIRKKEDEYNTFIKGKQLTENELIDLIVSFPNLLQRPIVTTDTKAVIADPPELINNIL
jgi:arsenate reductase (glutaredoxin)